MPELELYENLFFSDEELPAYMSTGIRNRQGSVIHNIHWHEQLEMHYIVDGAADMVLGQETLPVQEGDLVVVNSNTLHSGKCTRPPYKSYVLILDVADFSAELAKKNDIFVSLIRNDPVIRDYFQRMFREIEEKGVGYKSLCRGLLTELLVHLSRNYVDESLPERESARRKKNLERLNGVLCFIEDHHQQPITVNQLAEMACLSEDRFGHLFREVVGQPPLKYINQIRLRKAMNLLKTGAYTVTEVADAVGFQDYNHFGRLFRKAYGATPNRIRLDAAAKLAENSGNV